MYTSLGLSLRDTLHTMHAGLIFQHSIDTVSGHLADKFLKTACRTFRLVGDLKLPSPALAIFRIHPEQVTGKYGSLVSTCTATDFHDGILAVLRVSRNQEKLYVLLHVREFRFKLCNLLLCHLPQFLVLLCCKYLLGGLIVLHHFLVLVSSFDDRGQLLVLLVELHISFHIRNDLRVRKLSLKRFVFLLKAEYLLQK